MKSVVLVAFSGSWFCNSLTSRLRKSVELIDVAELDEDVEAVVEVDAAVAEETVMTGLSSPRESRDGTR